MRRRPFYLSAPGDVVALEAEAERILDSSPSHAAADLLASRRDISSDLATMLLYRACFRGGNGGFLDELHALPATIAPLERTPRILIVPGLHFSRHPETGADGSLVAGIVSQLGAKVEILRTDPRGSAGENGRCLADQLTRMMEESVWVVSISKGTADLRAALGQLGGWPQWLSGWINLSGVFQGTPVADKLTRPGLRSLMMQAVIAAGGIASRNIAEMRTDSHLWQVPVVPPTPERMIHILGFPPSWSIEMRIAHHYRWLTEHFGPNDGLIPLRESLEYPGRIVPVWGADHFMRAPDLARLVYRLAHYVDRNP